MINRRDLLRLLMLGVFLTAMFALAVVAVTPRPSAVIVPTQMHLPEQPEVAALSTSAGLPATSAPLPSNTAQADAADPTRESSPVPASSTPDTVAAANSIPVVAEAIEPTVMPVQPNPQAVSQAVPEQIVIAFSPNTSDAERAAYIAQVGGTVTGEIAVLDTVIVSVPAEVAAAPLPVSAVVAQAEPDYTVTALDFVPPNDPLFSQQWNLAAIGAPEAWALLPASLPAVTVAVIDSGVCADLPDLAGRTVAGWDFLDDDSTPQDTFGHGCAISAIIAANANDGAGMVGVAPNAQIMPLRVLDQQGIGPYSAVAAALVWAADHGAQIANLSLGGTNPSSVLENAIAYAVNKGVTVVAAAGNSGSAAPILYPAAYELVVSVGAFDSSGNVAAFSSGGPGVDVLAPGVGVTIAALNGSYTLGSGTSFAAPHVAAALAEGAVLGAPGARLWLGGDAAPTPVIPTAAPTSVTVDTGRYADLLARADNDGMVRVIVALDAAFTPEAQLDAQAVQAQRSDIAAAQSEVMSALAGEDAVVVAESDQWLIPYLALEVDRGALLRLISLPQVTGIEEDRLIEPSLELQHPDRAGRPGMGALRRYRPDGGRARHRRSGQSSVPELAAWFTKPASRQTSAAPTRCARMAARPKPARVRPRPMCVSRAESVTAAVMAPMCLASRWGAMAARAEPR